MNRLRGDDTSSVADEKVLGEEGGEETGHIADVAMASRRGCSVSRLYGPTVQKPNCRGSGAYRWDARHPVGVLAPTHAPYSGCLRSRVIPRATTTPWEDHLEDAYCQIAAANIRMATTANTLRTVDQVR